MAVLSLLGMEQRGLALALKRAIDVSVAGAVLVVAAPILAAAAVAIAATWIALVSTGDLQTYAVVIAIAMLFSAGVTIFGLCRGLKRISDPAEFPH